MKDIIGIQIPFSAQKTCCSAATILIYAEMCLSTFFFVK